MEEQIAKVGDIVRVHYSLFVEDKVIDSTQGKHAFELKLGDGRVIPGLERALEGMHTGESKEIDIPANDAFGSHREDLIDEVPVSILRGRFKPEPGMRLALRSVDGTTVPVKITSVGPERMTIDRNHPLAGKKVRLKLVLVSIR